MSHTPGPWDMDEGDYSVYQLETIMPITGPLDEIPNDSTKANARLMAAAPDLLEALQAFMGTDPSFINASGNVLTELVAEGDQLAPVVIKARAAIAKATGKS